MLSIPTNNPKIVLSINLDPIQLIMLKLNCFPTTDLVEIFG